MNFKNLNCHSHDVTALLKNENSSVSTIFIKKNNKTKLIINSSKNV